MYTVFREGEISFGRSTCVCLSATKEVQKEDRAKTDAMTS